MSAIALLRFRPLYHTRIWGGRRLESVLGRTLPDDLPYGESWELCDREEAQSVVISGPHQGRTLHELWSRHRAEVFGAKFAGHPAVRFPMLLKVLDCNEVPSLQVHPPAAVAESLKGEPKTEMWYVAHAEPGSALYAGVKRGVTRSGFEEALHRGAVDSLVHQVEPRTGEYMFVESGRLHALGGGLLVYEIQQNSDTTYRVFDWNRMGLDGRPRDLHIQQSLQCIDFEDFEPAMERADEGEPFVTCPYFEVSLQSIPAGEDATLLQPETFVCIAVTRGEIAIGSESVRAGEFVLVPAGEAGAIRQVSSPAGAAWLEMRIPY